MLIIISTAYMDEAERCSMAHLMQNGKLISSGAPLDILKENNVNSINELFIKKTGSANG
jgi:ABC-2 type transport system ATP-binding protein